MTGKLKLPKFQSQLPILMGIIVLMMIVLTIVSPNFLKAQNFSNILLKIGIYILIASAANLIMITGNLDLSVGAVLAFSGILHAYMCKHGVPIPLSILITCLAAMVWGVFNGFVVGKLRIVPVVATLGTMYMAEGLAFLIARWDGGTNIMLGLPGAYTRLGRAMMFGKIPIIIVFVVIVAAIFLFIEKKTKLGRFSYAIGDNRSAAELSGINVTKVIVILYALSALLAGFSGILQSSRVGLAAPNVGRMMETYVLIVCVLGGTKMSGGKGSMIGVLLGAAIIGLLENGLNLLGVDHFYQEVARGVLLIIAVLAQKSSKSVKS